MSSERPDSDRRPGTTPPTPARTPSSARTRATVTVGLTAVAAVSLFVSTLTGNEAKIAGGLNALRAQATNTPGAVAEAPRIPHAAPTPRTPSPTGAPLPVVPNPSLGGFGPLALASGPSSGPSAARFSPAGGSGGGGPLALPLLGGGGGGSSLLPLVQAPAPSAPPAERSGGSGLPLVTPLVNDVSSILGGGSGGAGGAGGAGGDVARQPSPQAGGDPADSPRDDQPAVQRNYVATALRSVLAQNQGALAKLPTDQRQAALRLVTQMGDSIPADQPLPTPGTAVPVNPPAGPAGPPVTLEPANPPAGPAEPPVVLDPANPPAGPAEPPVVLDPAGPQAQQRLAAATAEQAKQAAEQQRLAAAKAEQAKRAEQARQAEQQRKQAEQQRQQAEQQRRQAEQQCSVDVSKLSVNPRTDDQGRFVGVTVSGFPKGCVGRTATLTLSGKGGSLTVKRSVTDARSASFTLPQPVKQSDVGSVDLHVD